MSSDLRPRAGLSSELALEIKTAAEAFEHEMAGAHALPKPKGCPIVSSYGGMLHDYLVAAAERGTDQTSAELLSIHEHLRCTTAREFAMFFRALHSTILANAYDGEEPILRELDALAVPLTILLQDMGARGISPELGTWLYLRGELIAELSTQEDSVLDDLRLVVPHGSVVRVVNGSEEARIYDAIDAGAILGPCTTSELITPEGMTPLCPLSCASIPPKDLTPELGEQFVSACQGVHDLLTAFDDHPTRDAMFACVEAYKTATSQDGFAACLTTRVQGLSEDALSLDGSNQVRISKQCQVSQPTDDIVDAATRAAKIAEKKRRLKWLKETLQRVDDEIIEINLDPESGRLDFIRVDAQLEPIASDTTEDIARTQEELDELENGGGGTQRCSQDSEACSDSCDIQSQVQQLTEECLTETEEPDPPSNPDPIDPIGPEVDPDSPLGELMACLAKAASDDDVADQDSCDGVLTCRSGEVAVLFNGICVCDSSGTPIPASAKCEWEINCREDGPCTCDGAPLDGDPIPVPEDPYLLFEFRR